MVMGSSIPLSPRRALMKCLLGVPMALAAGRLQAQSPGSAGGVTFEMRLPAELLAPLRRSASYSKLDVTGDPATVDPTRGLPLVYLAVGVLLLPDLARSLLALYRDFKYGGTLIEVVNGKLVITQSDKLDADTVVIKEPSGKISVHRNRTAANLDKWTELLVSAGVKP